MIKTTRKRILFIVMAILGLCVGAFVIFLIAMMFCGFAPQILAGLSYVFMWLLLLFSRAPETEDIPPAEDYLASFEYRWNTELPDNMTELYGYNNIFLGEGIGYYVYDYDEDIDFLSDFTSEKDEQAEMHIRDLINRVYNEAETEYILDLNCDYCWKSITKRHDDKAYFVYVSDSSILYIIERQN